MEDNYSNFTDIIFNKKEDLKDYIASYIKFELNKRPAKDFLSFVLVDEQGKTEKTISFAGRKPEFFKVLFLVLTGKEKYNTYRVNMLITDSVIKYATESLIDFYRNDHEILGLSLDLLKKENFIKLIKTSISKKGISENEPIIKSLFDVFNVEKADLNATSTSDTIEMLDRILSSESIKNYVFDLLKDTELVNEIRWDLRKYLYTAMGITASGGLLAFLPIIVAGILVGAIAFKKAMISLISSGVANKITNNVKVITQALFSSIKFQEILSEELIGIIKSEGLTAEDLSQNISQKQEEKAKIKTFLEPEAMKVSNIFAYLKVLAAMMWADGKLQPQEIELWKKITSLDLKLSPKQTKELENWLKSGPNLSIIGAEITNKEERSFVMRQAMLMSMVDRELSVKEKELLKYLSEQFEIPESEMKSLVKDVKDLLSLG